MNVKSFTTDIDDLKLPFKEAVEDLKKENMSLVRELERYDANFKRVFGDYIDVLTDYKGLVEKFNEVERKLSGNSNYINNATIQNFYPAPSVLSTPLSPQQNQPMVTPLKEHRLNILLDHSPILDSIGGGSNGQ